MSARCIASGIALLAALLVLSACDTYRVEYHRRPAYYQKAAMGDLSDEVVLEDGTKLVFRTIQPRQPRQSHPSGNETGERKTLQIREEHEDGTVTLRGIVPEHVLTNLLTCLHNEEYELIWEQLLVEETRRAWEQTGSTSADFIDFFHEHRNSMIQAVNRIYLGLSSFETVMEYDDYGVLECRLQPSSARNLRFSRVRMLPTSEGLKLVNLR